MGLFPKVRRVPTEELAKNSEVLYFSHGAYDAASNEIYIVSGQNIFWQAISLVHELLHHVSHLMSAPQKLDLFIDAIFSLLPTASK